ncbi:MAG: ABC transporter permease subunit [Desulfuromonadaceae bacterium]|nr:ABC transporter permease subunit [Desulfuromonadaceae bacterium]
MLNNVSAIALLAFKEAIKQRVIYGLLIFAVLILWVAVLVSGFFLRDISKVMLDFCLAMVTVGGLTIPFFVAIHILAKDIERKTIFTLLTRSISRGQYVLGKFAGLSLLAAVVMLLLSGCAWVAMRGGIWLWGERFFAHVSWPDIAFALFLSFLSVLVLNAIAIFWSTLTTSSFLATLLTISSYIIGQLVDDVVRFITSDISAFEVTPAISGTVHVVKFLFPNLAAFDVKQAAAHGMTIPFHDVTLLTIYACAYIFVVLFLATSFFVKRDFA